MHESRLTAVVIDCLPDRFEDSVRFWATALGVPVPSRPRKNQRHVHLRRPEGEIEVLVQKVEAATVTQVLDEAGAYGYV